MLLLAILYNCSSPQRFDVLSSEVVLTGVESEAGRRGLWWPRLWEIVRVIPNAVHIPRVKTEGSCVRQKLATKGGSRSVSVSISLRPSFVCSPRLAPRPAPPPSETTVASSPAPAEARGVGEQRSHHLCFCRNVHAAPYTSSRRRHASNVAIATRLQ